MQGSPSSSVSAGKRYRGAPESLRRLTVGYRDPMEPVAEEVWWAGEQVTDGVRRVPILGDVTSRTRVKMLARATRQADGSWVVIEKPCTIDIETSGGVTLGFDPAWVTKIPAATFRYAPSADGWTAEPWIAGWGADDLDGNGVPGMSVTVDAPICDGSLDIVSRALTRATITPEGEAFGGAVSIEIDRTIAGASNPCLRLVPKHTIETVTGSFRFVRLPAAATCDSLGSEAWPATVPDVPPLRR